MQDKSINGLRGTEVSLSRIAFFELLGCGVILLIISGGFLATPGPSPPPLVIGQARFVLAELGTCIVVVAHGANFSDQCLFKPYGNGGDTAASKCLAAVPLNTSMIMELVDYNGGSCVPRGWPDGSVDNAGDAGLYFAGVGLVGASALIALYMFLRKIPPFVCPRHSTAPPADSPADSPPDSPPAYEKVPLLRLRDGPSGCTASSVDSDDDSDDDFDINKVLDSEVAIKYHESCLPFLLRPCKSCAEDTPEPAEAPAEDPETIV
jgi:hypothetical protein